MSQLNECPLCHMRVNDWQMACLKAMVVNGNVVHKNCLVDYYLRTGKNFSDNKT